MRVGFACLLFCGLSATLLAQATDDYFTDAPADIVADTTTKPNATILTSRPTTVQGNVHAEGGLLGGPDPVFHDPDYSGYYLMSSSVSFDSRPDTSLHAYGSLSTSLSGTAFSTPTIGELFIDYTWLDLVMFRFGKQSLTWGQGRLFNPANLVSDAATGVTLKAFVPVFGQGLTLVSIINPANMTDAANPSWKELVYNAQFAGDLGPLGWGVAGRYLLGKQQKASGFLKTTWAGIDLFTEGVWDLTTATSSPQSWLAGFYWEGGDPKIKMQGEATNTTVGLATAITLGDYRPALKWEHNYTDQSGQWTLGVEFSPAAHLNLAIGLPLIYGPTTGTYVASNPDPRKRDWVMGAKLSLDVGI